MIKILIKIFSDELSFIVYRCGYLGEIRSMAETDSFRG